MFSIDIVDIMSNSLGNTRFSSSNENDIPNISKDVNSVLTRISCIIFFLMMFRAAKYVPPSSRKNLISS